MPGIIGHFKKHGIQPSHTIHKNSIHSTDTLKELILAHNYRIMAINGPNNALSLSFHETPDQFIALFGHCFDRESFSELKAPQIDSFLRRKNLLQSLNLLEGAFHIAWLKKAENKFTLLNDRLGILPLYYIYHPDRFSFAPKMHFLGQYGLDDLNKDAFITFMMAGYCMGGTTLFEPISYLRPATILDIDLNTYQINLKTYWQMNYRAEADKPSKNLSRDLYEAILNSTKLLCPSETRSRSSIFLSGGWDSKGLLGAMMATGGKPSRIITNGEADHTPFSDTYLAKKIAAKYKIPYTLNLKDVALSNTNCLQGLKQCEIITDSSPENFGQQNPPQGVFSDIDYILKGDEVWGWQDMAYNRNQAIGHVMPNEVSTTFRNLFNGYKKEDVQEIYNQQISQILPGPKTSNWNDYKDQLYLYGRVNRYIFGLGGSDEEQIQVRRPFLTGMVLDVISRIPAKLRVQKNLYKEMMTNYHRELVSFGDCYTSSIPNYYAQMRPFIQQRMDAYFKENTDFNGLIDLNACLSLINGFAPSTSSKKSPSKKQMLRKRIENKIMHRVHRTSIYQKRAASSWEHKRPADERLAFRLWLLTEFMYGSN